VWLLAVRQAPRTVLFCRSLGALTPLIWEHVNLYDRFELDMATRLPLT
jgi:hypothetical protein